MTKVVIKQPHSKGDDEVRTIVGEVEQTLATNYDLQTSWNGRDTVEFKRSGLTGELCIEPGCVVIKLKLGMMLGMYSRKIQTELEKIMADKLS